MRGAGKEGRKGRGGEDRYHVYVRGALKWLLSGRAGGPPPPLLSSFHLFPLED